MKEEQEKKRGLPKINTIHYGGAWIATGLLVGAVLPVVFWFLFHKVFWILVILGALILIAFAVVFAIEMHQDFGAVPYYEKHLKETAPFDPQTQYAVIRSSICTGEKVAGFKNKTDGHFTEVMLIRSPEDEKRFKNIYGLESVKVEY